MGVTERYGIGARHIQIVLLTFGFFKDTWVLLTSSVTSNGVYAVGGFRAMYEATIMRHQDFELITYQTLFISKLLGTLGTLFVNSKYIMLSSGLIQSLCLTLVPVAQMFHRDEAACLLILAIESMTVLQIPASYTIMGMWTPEFELGRCSAALEFGNLWSIFLFQLLFRIYPLQADYLHYMAGVLVFAWCCLWLIFSTADPTACYFIDKEELVYIFKSIPLIRKRTFKTKIPIKGLFTCLPLYGFLMVNIAVNLPNITGRPHKLMYSYLKNVVHEDSTSAHKDMPAIIGISAITLALASLITDKVLQFGLNINNGRKIFSSIALWGTALALAFMGYSTNPRYVRMYFISSICFRNLSVLGHLLVPFNISPNYAGFVIGLSECIGTLFFPIIYSWEREVLRKSIVKETYNHYYYVIAGTIFVANTIFLMCGDIHRDEFDSIGTYSWRQESIHSYP